MMSRLRIGMHFVWLVLFLSLATASAAAQSDYHLPLIGYPSPICTAIVPACNLTTTAETENMPAWSPDGNRLLYMRHALTPASLPYAGIYLIDAKGGRQLQLAEGGSEPAWSPDGTKITFVRGALYIMNAGGGQAIELTGVETNRAQAHVWSPDGTKIAYQNFSQFDDCCDIAGALYVINADGSQPTKLANDVTVTRPSWSPDSSKIAAAVYYTDGTGITDIFVIDAGGSSATNLTQDDAYNSAAVWSPDGSKIAFTRVITGGSDLYVMKPDGSEVVKVTKKPLRFDTFGAPIWSPDSRKLLYLTILDNMGAFGIYVVDAAGGQDPKLIYSAMSGSWGQPVWSRDGRKIAFTSGLDIYVLGIEE